jgi:PAS domain S-box-containing protein
VIEASERMTTRPQGSRANWVFGGQDASSALGRSTNWAATSLGPVESWPESLRGMVRACLESKTALAIWAGPDWVLIHNDAYAPMLGRKHPWAMGQPAREVWSEIWDKLEPEFRDVTERGESKRYEDTRFRLRRDGREEEDAYFTYSLTPLRSEDDRVIGILNMAEETTTAVRARTEREELLSFSLSTARLGAWEVDLVDHTARRSLDHDRIFGYRELLPEWTYEMFLEHVLPEDRPAVDRSFREALERREDWSFECRIRRADGGTRWIWAAGRHRSDARGRPRIAGIVQDITDRKEEEEARRQSEEQYRTLFESIDEGFCVIEVIFDGERAVDYRFLQINPAFEKHTGLENAVGRRIRDIAPHHEQHWFDIYGKVARTGQPVRFEDAAAALGRHYDVYAFRVGPAERGQVAVLFSDITDRKRAEEAATEADRRKSEFLATLSHELRNPLAPVKNSLYVLDRVAPDSEQARRAREVIARQVDQLAHLVDELLDVTRVTGGKIRLQRRRLEINDLVRRTLDDHRSLFEHSGLDVDFRPASQGLFVDGDWTRLAQAVGNLLSNAVKFTPAAGRVTVSTDRQGDQAVIRVVDTGAGLDDETMSRLFQPFMQADSTLDRSKGGLGLGLALVKGLIEQHGGTVEARSDGPQRGAEFVLRLPLDGSSAPGEDARAITTPTAQPRRVLVIEDNVDAAESLREVLELNGHEVAVAYDGGEGVALAHEFRPQVVLCDLGLPGMDGFAVARAFRADALLRDARLIALSGYALPEDLQHATEAGFDGHIKKPPTLDQLESALRAETDGGSGTAGT